MMKIPKDPIMCLSFVNTQLRDYYADLDELCHDFKMMRGVLEEKLGAAGYFYKQELNQFR